jgi:lipopolysaccharide export system ATP-binding protein
MVTGLVPSDEGNISIDGFDVTGLPMYRRARLGVGYLPQEASIFRGLSVENNIRGVLEVVQKNRKERERRLDELLEEFHIAHLRKAPAISLSGGERRRLEIARRWPAGPPTCCSTSPSPASTRSRSPTSRTSCAPHGAGIGVLITDHNVRETLGLIDRAYIIHAGRF